MCLSFTFIRQSRSLLFNSEEYSNICSDKCLAIRVQAEATHAPIIPLPPTPLNKKMATQSMDASHRITTNSSSLFRSDIYCNPPYSQTLSWWDIRDRILILHIHGGIDYILYEQYKYPCWDKWLRKRAEHHNRRLYSSIQSDRNVRTRGNPNAQQIMVRAFIHPALPCSNTSIV